MHKSSRVVALLAISTVLLTLVIAGCGGSGATGTPGDNSFAASDAPASAPVQLASVAPPQSPVQAQAAAVAPAAVPALTLAIATSLNGTGTVKAATLTKAELLNTKKVLVSTATITAGVASFPVSNLTAGHYFIRVNGLAKDLVPTKIDSVTASTTQFVGTTLRTSVIGTVASPKYKFVTYSLGQTQHAVVGFLTGLAGTPVQYGYAMLYKNPAKLETRVLGTAALLANVGLGGPHTNSTWVLGATNHGKSINTSCKGCHGSPTKKPATYAAISAGNGWCYKCHYGSAGVGNGLVNPKQ